MSAAARSILRERKNWLVHELYVRRDFGACLRLIDEQLDASGGLSEYALYVKGEWPGTLRQGAPTAPHQSNRADSRREQNRRPKRAVLPPRP